MNAETADGLAKQISEAGYTGLFLSGDHNAADAIWAKGQSRSALEQIVQGNQYADIARILASEVLYAKVSDYPPDAWADTLGKLYAQALTISGDTSGPLLLTGNLWGYMYSTDRQGVTDYGPLGAHLVQVGRPALPYLTLLLDDTNLLFYEGSQEATLGNSLRYRVKDAAAYYIGKISGIPVAFHEQPQERDAEIERLRAALRGQP